MKKSILFLVLVVSVIATQSTYAKIKIDKSTVPDGGTTAVLLTVAVGGIALCKKAFRR